MNFFDKLKEERTNYISEQESLKSRYYNDSKKVFQQTIDDLIDGYKDILIEKVKSGRTGKYEFFNLPEVSHPGEGLYSKEYEGYEAIDLFQLLLVGEEEEKTYYLDKEVILDDALLEFWELLLVEGLSPYFLISHNGKSNQRTINLGVTLPE